MAGEVVVSQHHNIHTAYPVEYSSLHHLTSVLTGYLPLPFLVSTTAQPDPENTLEGTLTGSSPNRLEKLTTGRCSQ